MDELKLMMLESEAIPKMWDTLYPVIKSSLPVMGSEDDEAKRRNYLLASVLKKVLQVWFVLNESGTLIGCFTTVPQSDIYTGKMDLLVYTIHSFDNDFTTWRLAYDKLHAYCKRNNFHKIVAYIVEPKVLELVKSFGANVMFYTEMEV